MLSFFKNTMQVVVGNKKLATYESERLNSNSLGDVPQVAVRSESQQAIDDAYSMKSCFFLVA